MRGVVRFALLALLALGVGCGASVVERRGDGLPNRTEQGLEAVRPSAAAGSPMAGARPDLRVSCGGDACPVSVGVLYHVTDGVPQRCTAALVGPDRVLTAGHCLPRDQRAQGASCAGVFVAFAASGELPSELRECRAILGATPSDDPLTLAPDYAVVTLDTPTARPAFALDPAPLAPGTVVTVVSSTPEPDDESAHALRSRRCRVDGAEEAAAVLGERAHDVSWLGLCPIRPGNSGAPVLDELGRVRGVVHGGSPPFFAHAVVTPASAVPAR